jgi:glutathione peroxidase-family protein
MQSGVPLTPLGHRASPLTSLQFGHQEPKNDAAIGEFCTLKYDVTFPLMKKSEVNGGNTNEVYEFLKNKKPGFLGLTRIRVCTVSRAR